MSDNLKKNVISGLSWTFLNQIVSQLISVGLSVILARLISPKEFGLIALITIFTNFGRIFVDFGFGSALIQRKKITSEYLSTVFWFNLLSGAFLCLLFFTGSGVIAAFYDNEQLALITKVLSFTFLITSLTSIQSILLTRQLNFKKQAIVNWVAMLVSSGVAIAMAFIGFGVWSLVVQSLLSSAIVSGAYWYLSDWRPTLVFNFGHFKGMLGFGSSVAGNSIFNYWTRNMDNLLIGKFLGSASLGIYGRAYALMLLPVSNISGAVSRVMFPALSSIQDDLPRVRSIYLKVSRTIAIVTFPLMFGLCAVAEPFVLALYGQQWEDMIPILKILSILGAFQSVLSLNGILYNSQGKAALALRVTIVLNAFLIIAFYSGLKLNGLIGLTWGYFLVATLGSVPILYFATKLINTRLLDQALNLWKIGLSTLIMFVLTILLGKSVYIIGLPAWLQLIILVLFGVLVYSLAIALVREDLYVDLVEKKIRKFIKNVNHQHKVDRNM